MTHLQPIGWTKYRPSPNLTATLFMGESAKLRSAGLDLNHLEVLFSRTTFGTFPVQRYVFPAGTGRDAFVRQTLLLVVDKSTDNAHVSLHIRSESSGAAPMRTVKRVGAHSAMNCLGTEHSGIWGYAPKDAILTPLRCVVVRESSTVDDRRYRELGSTPIICHIMAR